MSVICPTVLAETTEEFSRQLLVASEFADRIQIDLMDGDFAKPQSVGITSFKLTQGKQFDIHLMYKNPGQFLYKLLEHQPAMVIIHAEADVDHIQFARKLKENNVKAGICLLADTRVDDFGDKFKEFDHFLVFGGTLGSFGGNADLYLLEKVSQAKRINPNLEIGWDGGANDKNALELSRGGVDVINVGGYIQKSTNPQAAYKTLTALLN